MKKILVTGGSGFLGQMLIQRFLQPETRTGAESPAEHPDEIIAIDQTAGVYTHPRLRYLCADISEPAQWRSIINDDISGIVHLAAVVSGTAERDFDLGMRVNLDGTRALLDAARSLSAPPRFLFSSSLAVYGGTLPDVVDDNTPPAPQSSYGTQKLIGEQLVSDYTRKSFIDGRCVRIPTVSVRPGKPNGAASSFASGIIREPMAGERAICPIDPDTPLWLASPRHVIESLIHAFLLSPAQLDDQPDEWRAGRAAARRPINLPGLTITPREMADTLRNLAGADVANLIDWKPDPDIKDIVETWPARIDTRHAFRLGFAPAGTGAQLVGAYVQQQ
ncbi:NAD-dependent epimerase [Pollutimonas nitritireducens]|uniref:NAD-dependent epimerase n=1 Tax=Pollutimonas nitritireducens TaxID=2045209 RepID=A0A2N4UJT6_9BURK|nr:D-erythronate dehydrogenase [Pollutimonas nitritireducens]PLC55283.1 NAD-dependent epimerase [Pollutimonas nitritireducens]